MAMMQKIEIVFHKTNVDRIYTQVDVISSFQKYNNIN